MSSTPPGNGYLYIPHSNHKPPEAHYRNDHPTSSDLWDRLSSNFTLPDYEDSPRVQQEIHWYQHHRDKLQKTLVRSEPYMYYIFDQAKTRNIPAELILLPTIESAYNPFAYSSAGASGLWQMMARTAHSYGVDRNYWFDGRRDICNSTGAALNHLAYLNDFFNHDWPLAIAAYDAGEGTVLNAIQRNIVRGQPTDFWSLPLPLETQSYVPRLFAVVNIVKHPEKYGFTLPYIKNTPYLTQLPVHSNMRFCDVAKVTGLSMQEVKQLNPGYNHAVAAPGRAQMLVLPVAKASNFSNLWQRFSARFARRTAPALAAAYYHVRAGDTLYKIARLHRVAVPVLRHANKLKNDALKIGQQLVIPPSTRTAAARRRMV